MCQLDKDVFKRFNLQKKTKIMNRFVYPFFLSKIPLLRGTRRAGWLLGAARAIANWRSNGSGFFSNPFSRYSRYMVACFHLPACLQVGASIELSECL